MLKMYLVVERRKETGIFTLLCFLLWADGTAWPINPWSDIPGAANILSQHKAPKSWHHYVKCLAFHQLNAAKSGNIVIQTFQTLSKATIKFAKLSKIERFENNKITMATGMFTSLYFNHFTCKDKKGLVIDFGTKRNKVKSFFKVLFKRKTLPFRRIFHLDKRLSLNLTFLNLIFLEKDLHFCSTFQIVTNKRIKATNFCGKHGRFAIFTPGNQVEFYGSMGFCIYHKLIVSFMVIDTNFTITMLGKPKSLLLLDSICLRQRTVLSEFLFQTQKHKMLLIQTTLSSQLVATYDGPSSLSPLLTKLAGHYLLSAFLGKVHILCERRNISLNFTSRSQLMSRKLLTKPTTLTWPNDECTRTICLIQLRAELGSQVNVSLLDMNFQGENTAQCLLGGLVTIDLVGSNLEKEMPVFCIKYTRRNFFSQESSLIVILFQYLPVQKTNLFSYISGTICSFVHLNLCKVSRPCDSATILMRSPCERNLKGTRNATVSLRFNPDTHMSVKFSRTTSSKRQCVVLLFAAQQTAWFNEHGCLVSIGFEQILSKCYHLQNTITANLVPFMSNYEQETLESCHSDICNKADMMNFIALYGSVDQFCVGINGSLSCYQSPPKTNKLDAIWKFDRTDIQNLFTFTTIKTPMKRNRLVVEVALSVYHHSSMEMVSEIVPMKCTRHNTDPSLVTEVRYGLDTSLSAFVDFV